MTKTILIQTTSSFSCHSITNHIQTFIDASLQKEGVVCAFCKHTTTALIVNEMEERLIMDLEKWLKELAPPLQGYMHDDLHLRENIPKDEINMLTLILIGNSKSFFKDNQFITPRGY